MGVMWGRLHTLGENQASSPSNQAHTYKISSKDPATLVELGVRRVINLDLPLEDLPVTVRHRVAREVVYRMAELAERRTWELLMQVWRQCEETDMKTIDIA